jgi:hypothetical protein
LITDRNPDATFLRLFIRVSVCLRPISRSPIEKHFVSVRAQLVIDSSKSQLG